MYTPKSPNIKKPVMHDSASRYIERERKEKCDMGVNLKSRFQLKSICYFDISLTRNVLVTLSTVAP